MRSAVPLPFECRKLATGSSLHSRGDNFMRRRTFLKSAMAVTLGGGFMMNAKQTLAQTVPMGALLEPWTGAHNGTPRFDLIEKSAFKDAVLKGMDLKRAELKTITGQSDKPT